MQILTGTAKLKPWMLATLLCNTSASVHSRIAASTFLRRKRQEVKQAEARCGCALWAQKQKRTPCIREQPGEMLDVAVLTVGEGERV